MKKIIALLVLTLIILVYLFVLTKTADIKTISKHVNPTVSLYPNTKPLKGKFLLLNDRRQTTTLSQVTQGRWSILYFGYASCPDVCPVDLAILSQTLNAMKHADKLQVVFISVDPKRDIGNMDKFVKRFNPSFVGLSAEDEILKNMTKTLGVYHQIAQIKQKANMQNHDNHKGNYLVDHTASYLLLNPNLELTGLLTNPHRATKMAAALDLIIETLK
ncbi:Cytochrome oxidase biogenesis protein Sco1/SenC/PrrC, putative copper metallochaperone [uncultured Candidatus Thioglobus sp.]|nr:Cytochrome oxidase biogenesis protein Sco1/SenC/PrrC, putative copper metallochaperone [uncultured Candidatus Thioglobus sp.]